MEKRGVKPVGTVIVEAIVDVVCFQPAAGFFNRVAIFGNDSNLLIVFYVQIVPDDFVMQLHR
ncbi:hypothetical protein RAN94_08615, partial [Enterobacter hormaechei subsp. xiangfangensis]|uniref:hypothetical protein n=1 Tax=Enterobacter hormaechei TaxID=158836 RepID=UPI0028768862